MSNDPQVTWLTQEAHDRLTAELEQLSGPARKEIADRIEAAREEGDLKENGGYHAAKDEQGKIEARIRQLTELLKHATVGEADFDGTVEPGTVVTAVIARRRVDVPRRQPRDRRGRLGPHRLQPGQPVGAAIVGMRAGDETTYTAPNGKEIAVTVTKVERYEP